MSLGPRIDAKDWIETFDNEYLKDLIPLGGASIRFVSGDPSTLKYVSEELALRADHAGLRHRAIDPAKPSPSGKPWRLHLAEEFYRAAIAEFDWLASVRDELRKHLRARGLNVGERELSDLAGIAEDNEWELPALMQNVQRGYVTDLVRDAEMLSEFRLAMSALTGDLLMNEPSMPSRSDIVLGWLSGATVPGSLAYLKSVGIYDRLKGTNARPMLVSFLHWLRRAGGSGLLLTLDLRPYETKKLTKPERTRERERRLLEGLRAKRPHEEILAEFEAEDADPDIAFPDKPFLQMLDLLRHFLDDIETFPGFALVVLTSDRFYDTAQPRNYSSYNALASRISQEVRDANRANPVAILNHLEAVR